MDVLSDSNLLLFVYCMIASYIFIAYLITTAIKILIIERYSYNVHFSKWCDFIILSPWADRCFILLLCLMFAVVSKFLVQTILCLFCCHLNAYQLFN